MRNILIIFLLSMLMGRNVAAQELFAIDLESVTISGQNNFDLLNFTILSTATEPVRTKLRGTLQFMSGTDKVYFEETVVLQSGLNMIKDLAPQIQLQFTDGYLRSLYTEYGRLPLGKMEYCVSLSVMGNTGEQHGWQERAQECIYINNEDFFLIELLDPEDGAVLKEMNPQLSWIVNSPLVGSLDYRLMLTTKRMNQSNADAIKRNPLIYDESHIMSTSQIYPMYAKPLEYNQEYVWNVEAYYGKYLMGTAIPWKFILLPDTVRDNVDLNPSYIDILGNVDAYRLIAFGQVKLKYNLMKGPADSLQYELYNHKNKPVKIRFDIDKAMRYGDNRIIIDFYNNQPLKHNKKYTLAVSGKYFKARKIEFIYKNPDFQ